MEVLARKLEETQREISEVRGQVVDALRAFYTQAPGLSVDQAIEIAAKWSATGPSGADGAQSELQSKLQRLNIELLDAVDSLQLDGAAPQSALVASLAERESLKKQIDHSRAAIALIEKLTDIDRRLTDIDVAVDHRQFVVAAEAITAIEGLIAALLKDEPNAEDAEIIQSVRMELSKKKNRLLSQLKQFYSSSVQWSEGSLKLVRFTTAPASPTPETTTTFRDELRDFWKACALLDLLAPRLKDIAKAISQQLVKPMLHFPGVSIEHTHDQLTGSRTVRIQSKGSKNDDAKQQSGAAGGDLVGVQEKFGHVVAILLFVHAELFAGSAELMNRLGDVLWKIPGNLEALLMSLLRDKIPQDVQALHSYRDVLLMTVTELENKLVAVGFSACSNSQLRGFVSQLNQLHSKKRREHVLQSGRDMMRGGYNDSVKVIGANEKCSFVGSSSGGKTGKSSDKPGLSSASSRNDTNSGGIEGGCFEMPNYRVSIVARDIVDMAHETLVEACGAEPTSARLLFQTSRDVLFLFRAVVPTLYAVDIANDPRACMLFHNDCMYIAHHMLTIGYLYKQRLPPPLNQTATMIDMVPGFRNTAEKALTSYASSLTSEFLSATAALPPLRDIEKHGVAERIEEFFKGVMYKLSSISSAWRDGLPAPVYKNVMAKILDPVVGKFVDAVIAEQRISPNAAAQLHHSLSLLLECDAVFDSPAQAEALVISLARLRKLNDLLADPLAAAREKVLASGLSEFSRDELVGLVKSLYRETPEQQALLRALARA